jgi:hypothetical protein
VPKRTNTFQRVVAIIHEHLAGDATVEESAMLVNEVTGRRREVDVVVRSKVAGYETVVAIEATSGGRRANVEWVERMVAKHKHLPGDKVVLIAEAGFTQQARALAVAEGMVPLAPEDIAGDDPDAGVVARLPSLWPKTLQLIPEGARVWVLQPDGEERWFRAPANLDILLEDGESGFDLVSFLKESHSANFQKVAEQIGLAKIDEDLDAYFTLQLGPPVTIGIDGETRQLYLRWLDDETGESELHPVQRIGVHGRAIIRVSEIKLEQKRLGEIDVNYAYGTGRIDGKPGLLVVSEGEHGAKLTFRAADDKT